MDRSIHPPVVKELHCEFDGWLGDALLETFPVFITTEHAMASLQAISATGVEFDSVEVTESGQFRELYPDRVLPSFVWIKPHGKAGGDDFGVSVKGRLVISERVLDVLTACGISNALVEPFGGEES